MHLYGVGRVEVAVDGRRSVVACVGGAASIGLRLSSIE